MSVPQANPTEDPILRCTGVVAGHDGLAVVNGLDLTVGAGEVVALLGANGVGKTTTLLTISGLIPLLGGSIELQGRDLEASRGKRIGSSRGSARSQQVLSRARLGIAHVPEDRALFFDLTVQENLRLGLKRKKDRKHESLASTRVPSQVEDGTNQAEQQLSSSEILDQVLGYFPALTGLLGQPAGLLSGGQQQMLAIGRGLMSQPKLLMVDELSLGLAPILVEQLLPVLRTFAQTTGAGILIVEQHVHLALAVSDRAYLLRRGKATLSGSSAELSADPDLVEAGYFGE
jgi:branched-chain amino acid transport system ATP-binding protein